MSVCVGSADMLTTCMRGCVCKCIRWHLDKLSCPACPACVLAVCMSWPLFTPKHSYAPAAVSISNEALHIAEHDLQVYLKSLHNQLDTVALHPEPGQMVGNALDTGCVVPCIFMYIVLLYLGASRGTSKRRCK